VNLETIHQEIQALRLDITKLMGTRLNHEAMADRLGVTRRTLYNRIQAGTVPRPNADGVWLLSDVMTWEAKK
jgi:predicted DNA-binding transcriptional regulator AlpA